MGCWKQLSAHIIIMGEQGGLAGHGLVEDLCSGLLPWAEALHGHSWSLEDAVHRQAACSSGLLIPRVFGEPK